MSRRKSNSTDGASHHPSHRKRWIGLVSMVVVIFLVLLVYVRWRTWFVDYDEEPYTLPQTAHRLLITPGEDGLHDRNITWVSGSDEARSVVLMRPDSTALRTLGNVSKIETQNGTTFIHSVVFKNLPEGRYRFAVYADSVRQASGAFLIPSQSNHQSFIYLGDILDENVADSRKLFTEIYHRNSDVDAWLFTGNAINMGHNKFWNIWYYALERISQNVPFIAVPGGAEYSQRGLIKRIDPRWTPSFNFPNNGPKSQLGESYFIDYPSCRIICLDSEGLQLDFDLFSVRKWLRKTLAERSDAFKIVVMHHPIHNVQKGRITPLINTFIKNILEDAEHGADLVLTGHDLAYSRIISSARKGTQLPVYVVSSCSEKSAKNGIYVHHDKLASGVRLYQVIDIEDDLLTYYSYTEDHQLYDKVIIHRNGKVEDMGQLLPEHIAH